MSHAVSNTTFQIMLIDGNGIEQASLEYLEAILGAYSQQD